MKGFKFFSQFLFSSCYLLINAFFEEISGIPTLINDSHEILNMENYFELYEKICNLCFNILFYINKSAS